MDNLSEEVRKGQGEKAQAGIWPTSAPMGYRNVTREDGKRVIEPDPERAPVIRRLFELAATGEYSTAMLAKEAAQAGLVTRRAKHPPDKTDIYRILRNPLYVGDVLWQGEIFQGIHTPLVTRELWDRVQRGFDDRYQNQHETQRRDMFAYAGLVSCGHCGCAMPAEIKKEKYIYYHCTGQKGDCGEPYVREEVLTEAFGQALKVIALPGPAMDWLVSALRKSHGDQQQFHVDSIKRLEEECARLQRRLDAMYMDKLDGVIDNASYLRNALAWNEEIRTHRAAISRHENANRVYLEEGLMLLTLAQDAYDLFLEADAPTRRKLFGFLLSNSSFKEGKLTVEYRKPYVWLAELHDQIDPSDPSNGTGEGGPLQTPGRMLIELSGSTPRGGRMRRLRR